MEPSNPNAPPAERRRAILLVDDEDLVRRALTRSLRREPYDLDEAAAPAEALEKLKVRAYDLILADHLMPGMTGLELLSIARDRWPDTMRVLLTGHADLQTAIDAINHGEIFRFLTKPWNDSELKVTLFNAFSRQDLERENRRLLAMVRRQAEVLDKIEQQYPGIAQVRRDSDGAIVLSEEELKSLGETA